MWASRYWADRMWAPRYWCKVGQTSAIKERRMTDFPDRVGSRSNIPASTQTGGF
jgi:hypothetical protein